MSEERTKVLEMLAVGTISIEQASQLLDALGEQQLTIADAKSRGGSESQSKGDCALGLGTLTPAQLVELRMHDVSPDFIRELWEVGYKNMSVTEIAELAMHGVNIAFIQEMRDAGYANLSVGQLTELKMFGISSAYISELREVGYVDLPVDQLVELGMHGVNANFVREMHTL